jgi:two-component system CheB/CheR fusion protein
MGASAGGLEALQRFFTRMPSDSGVAFVIVQHLDPRHATLMPELLGRTTRMSVEQVRDQTPVQADHVYVIPPNATLTIEGGILRARPPVESQGGLRMSIDRLFQSLAEDQGHAAVCLLFSGTGSDGTRGLRSVKEHGGMAMAQSPESAKHDTLLRSAIATGMVDHVLPPEEMPARLVPYVAHLRELHDRNARGALFEGSSDDLVRVCALLRRKTGHDFSSYKTATLVRRIQRRMQVQQVPSVRAYLERLRLDPKEPEELFRDLLIGVTQFFRDPEAFGVVAREVLPRLFDEAGADGTIRIWTPGCSTGEEVYSVAILVLEEMARRGVRPGVQIFAGDIDDEALEFARLACYPETIAGHVTPERLERFFVEHPAGYQVARDVREMCIFSTHNLIRDPPFSRIDLVVCRNLLIYLGGDLQRHATNLFHHALRRGGYLFLGPSEGISGPSDLFRTVDKKHRVFQRNETVSLPTVAVPAPGQQTPWRPARPWIPRIPSASRPEIIATLERVLLDHYAPAWVIVNAQGESIYFSPRTGRFLEPAAGTPTMDILGMARRGLRLDLRTALHKAVKTGESVTREGVTVEANGQVQPINLVVRPLKELGQDPGLFLVVFQEAGPPTSSGEPPASDASAGAPGDPLVQQLESELRITKEHLQATLEEVETSNEELKSSNEELLSTNEELQSANEELQTSKEELQSVNEELETINAELGKKVEELDDVNGDLQNLLQSTRIPTVFLDESLRIKRFTEAATAVFRLIGTDVGRPITDLAPRFDGDVFSDLEEVRRTLSARERRVRLVDGTATYLMRVLPYRRVDGVVDGEVLTFLDVTELDRTLEQHARLASVVESSRDAIVGRTFDGTIVTWNAGAEAMFGYSASEAIGSPISLIVPEDQREQVQEIHHRLRRGVPVDQYESVRVARGGRRINVSAAVALLKDGNGQVVGASMILRDITELKRTQEALRRELHERDRFLALLSHELRNPLAPLRTSLELLRRRPPDPEQSESSLNVMDRQLAHLTSLVDQLLDAARISNSKIVLDREDLDLVELVRAVVEDHGKLLADSGLEVKLHLPARPLHVRADRVRMSQALGNLLVNAGKFTPRGGSIEVSLCAEADARSATVSVKDSGMGVEPDMLAHLFRPFTQGANAAGRGRGGLGLGLALVRALVESHGGTVEARSSGPDQGAEFSIHLPLVAEAERRTRGKSAVGSRHGERAVPRRILVVEDNLDASESLRLLLTLCGHDVDTASDGRAALERARAFRPDVVLCDLGLPGDLDGFAVAEQVRADSDLGSPYLIALTGFGQAEDREQARISGFDRHITKPADPDVLRRLLDELPRRE